MQQQLVVPVPSTEVILFQFCDKDGNVATVVTADKMAKGVHPYPAFNLKKLSNKKGEKPCVFLFKTAEKDPKQSCFIEDWLKVKPGHSFWAKQSDFSVKVVNEKTTENVEKEFEQRLNAESAVDRAQQFSLLEEALQKEFELLPTETQIRLLKVPNKMKKEFMRPGQLLPYVKWVGERRERRAAEKERRLKKELELAQANLESYLREKELYNNGYRSRRLDEFDVDGVITASGLLIARTYDIVGLGDVKEKITQSALLNTSRLFDEMEDAWWTEKINSNVLHIIYFFYVIRFIRTERTCGRKHHIKRYLKR